MTLTAQADRVFTAPANGKPVELGVDIEIRALPEQVEILVGDVTKVPNPRSGREMLAMAPLAVPVLMKDYGVFAATRIAADAEGLADSEGARRAPRLAAALDRLRWHGVQHRRKSRTTRSWRSSGSRSPTTRKAPNGRSRVTRKRG